MGERLTLADKPGLESESQSSNCRPWSDPEALGGRGAEQGAVAGAGSIARK